MSSIIATHHLLIVEPRWDIRDGGGHSGSCLVPCRCREAVLGWEHTGYMQGGIDRGSWGSIWGSSAETFLLVTPLLPAHTPDLWESQLAFPGVLYPCWGSGGLGWELLFYQRKEIVWTIWAEMGETNIFFKWPCSNGPSHQPICPRAQGTQSALSRWGLPQRVQGTATFCLELVLALHHPNTLRKETGGLEADSDCYVVAVSHSPLSPAAASLVALGNVSAALFPNTPCNLLKKSFHMILHTAWRACRWLTRILHLEKEVGLGHLRRPNLPDAWLYKNSHCRIHYKKIHEWTSHLNLS